MGSYSVRKKVIQISVLLMSVIVLYRFGKWQEYDRTVSSEKAIEAEPIYDSNSNISSEIWEEDNRMPGIELDLLNSMLKVTIRNSEEYEVFVNMLDDFTDYSIWELDMSGTNTTVYLDEIMACSNFEVLDIDNGGIIAIKNEDDFKAEPPKVLRLHNVFNMPKMNMSFSLSRIDVAIRNDEEYEVFINMLKYFADYSILELDMLGTSTTVYLDEIMESGNFTTLKMKNGGIIAIKNKDNLRDYSLESFELYNVFETGENLLNHVSASRLLVFESGDNYTGSVPIKELLDKTDCKKIAILLDEKVEEGLDYGEESYVAVFGQESSFCQMPYEEDRILRGIYRVNEGDYSYTSYEFYKPESKEEVCAVYIGVDYREGDDERCVAMLQVPQDRYSDISRKYVHGIQIRVEDMNFDGYKDICFSGADTSLDVYDLCCVFLWNEQEKRYTICDTAPRYIGSIELGSIDSEKKRLTYATFGYSWNEYYIYEYRNGIYHEKKLENGFSKEKDEESESAIDKIIWNYSEDGALKETLEYIFDNEENASYITYQGKGGTEKEVLEGEQNYIDVGKKYFPEFDFYWGE